VVPAALGAAASQNKLDYWFKNIQPSLSLKTVIIWDVPVDVRGYAFVLK
jgi:hypothetical protein